MKTNPDNYKWGLFYFDTKDSGIIVPKVNQYLGWTINFSNPFSYLIILAVVLIVVFAGRF